MDYTIYSYFNQIQVQGVLNAIVMLVGSGGVDGDYLSLIRIAGMIGLMIAIAYGFVRARGEDAGAYLVMIALFYGMLFTPRVTVTIVEAAGTGAPVQVANVPIGLGFFASTTSKIGHWLTQKTETFFALPDSNLNFASHGLMGGARALREASSAAVQDPVAQQDMITFMRDCVNPELISAPAALTTLLQSKDIWADISTLGLINSGRMMTKVGDVSAKDCQTAYTELGATLTAETTTELGRIARLLSPNATAVNANTILGAMLPAAEGLIMTASASAAAAVKQRMMINLLNDTSKNVALATNDPVAAQNAMAAAMAATSANTAYKVMATLAKDTLPMIRNAIELVVLGVFPIVLILIIIAGTKGGLVLRSYVMTLLWVQLWAPLYAIVNYVGTLAGANSMKAALAGIDGVAVANAAALVNSSISAEAIAGVLTISVPMIALALVKGGEVAMSGVVQGVSGPAQQAATKTGEQAGMGNYNLGNIGWGNVSTYNHGANKSASAPSYQDPGAYEVDGKHGKSWTSINGPDAGAALGYQKKSDWGGVGGVTVQSSAQLSNSDVSGRTVSGGQATSARLDTIVSAMLGSETGAATMRALASDLSKIFGTGNLASIMGSSGHGSGSATTSGMEMANNNAQGVEGKTTLSAGIDGQIGGTAEAVHGAQRSTTTNARHPSPGVPPATAQPGATQVAPTGTGSPGAAVPLTGEPQGASSQPSVVQSALPQSAGQPLLAGTTAGVAPNTGVPTAIQPPSPAQAPGPQVVTSQTDMQGERAKRTVGGKANAAADGSLTFSQKNALTDGSKHGTQGEVKQFTQEQYQRGIDAVERRMATVKDAQTRQAMDGIKAALEERKGATLSTTTSVSDLQSAGNEHRATRGNAMSSSIANSRDGYDALVALFGGDTGKVQQAISLGLTPQQQMAAQQYLAGRLTDNPATRAFLESNGMQLPNNADALKTVLSRDVAAADHDNKAVTAAEDIKNKRVARQAQAVDPRDAPDTESVSRETEAAIARIEDGQKTRGKTAQVAAGAAIAGQQIYDAINKPGFETWLNRFNNIDGFNATKTTPDDIKNILSRVAETSPTVSNYLAEMGEPGAKPNPSKLDYLVQQVEAENKNRLNALNGR
jgi:hypothetical protein